MVRLINFNKPSLEKKGGFAENLWRDKFQQELRFEITNRYLRDGEVLVDVGAGTGDLPEYLLKKGRVFSYIGIEKLREAASKARSKGFSIIEGNIITMNIDRPLGDVVVSWGVAAYFNEIRDMTRYDAFFIFVSKLIALSRRLVLFDIWDEHTTITPGFIASFDIGKIRNITKSIFKGDIIIKDPIDPNDPEGVLFILHKR